MCGREELTLRKLRLRQVDQRGSGTGTDRSSRPAIAAESSELQVCNGRPLATAFAAISASSARRVRIGLRTWDDCNTNPRVRAAGSNLIVTVDIVESYFGTLDGTYAGTERDVVYADGTATFTGRGTFSGSVDGLTGTGRMLYEGAVGTSGVMPATGPNSGTWGLIGESGALRGVVARGHWGGAYSGQVVVR